MYAGAYPYSQNSTWVDGTACTEAYAGSDPTTDIETTELDLTTVVVNGVENNSTGVALKYKGGSVCPTSPTGALRTFTVNIYCNSAV